MKETTRETKIRNLRTNVLKNMNVPKDELEAFIKCEIDDIDRIFYGNHFWERVDVSNILMILDVSIVPRYILNFLEGISDVEERVEKIQETYSCQENLMTGITTTSEFIDEVHMVKYPFVYSDDEDEEYDEEEEDM